MHLSGFKNLVINPLTLKVRERLGSRERFFLVILVEMSSFRILAKV